MFVLSVIWKTSHNRYFAIISNQQFFKTNIFMYIPFTDGQYGYFHLKHTSNLSSSCNIKSAVFQNHFIYIYYIPFNDGQCWHIVSSERHLKIGLLKYYQIIISSSKTNIYVYISSTLLLPIIKVGDTVNWQTFQNRSLTLKSNQQFFETDMFICMYCTFLSLMANMGA